MKLINGDSLSEQVLNQIENNSIDIVFTSPPYNLGNSNYFGNWYSINTTNPGPKYKGNANAVKKDIHKMLYLLNDYYCDKIIWNKEMGIPHGRNSKVMTATFEEIFIFSKKATKRVGTKEWYGNVNNLFTMKGNRHNPYAKLHSAMFPIELPLYILKTFVKDGGVVADPFMGLGTTGIACKELGLDFVGIELDEEYFNIAKERIKEKK